MGDRDQETRSRAWAIIATVVVHAGLLAVSLSTPSPPPPRVQAPDLRIVEIWDDATQAQREAPAPTPARASEPEAVPAEPAPIVARAHSRARSQVNAADARPQGRAHGEAASPSSGAASPLALSGLRASHRAGSGGVPTLDPPTHGRAVFDASGDAAFARPERDGKPRSLTEAGFRPARRDGKRILQHEKFRATLHPDGRVTFLDLPPLNGTMPGPAEAAVAASGQELSIKEKRQLLEDTFELRVSMAVDFAEKNLERKLRGLYRDLLAVWRDTKRSAVQRRKALFERWDECEEVDVSLPDFVDTMPDSIDEKRRAAGQKAREQIEAFIRTHLPAGSTDAYPSDELRRLDAKRQSRAHFDPYGGGRRSTRGPAEGATTGP